MIAPDGMMYNGDFVNGAPQGKVCVFWVDFLFMFFICVCMFL